MMSELGSLPKLYPLPDTFPGDQIKSKLRQETCTLTEKQLRGESVDGAASLIFAEFGALTFRLSPRPGISSNSDWVR